MTQAFRGRASLGNPKNRFLENHYEQSHVEAIDIQNDENPKTEYFIEHPKKIINKVESSDVPMSWSLNPYQGCEHGCIYCYARPTHEYWGFSPGLDFERKIIIKENAPQLLEKRLLSRNWQAAPIMFSGNTDCYQPIEKKKKLTRQMLEILLKYNHPVGIITKNALVCRDLDILKPLAERNLVHVAISVTTADEQLRSKLEPRTSTYKNRIKAIRELSQANIPVTVMVAPVIPGLTSHEIPTILKAAANAGARDAGIIIARLNGPVGKLFEDWINLHYPDKAQKVINQIKACHGGKLSDSRPRKRMKGEGLMAESINRLFKLAKAKYFEERSIPPYNTVAFSKNAGQLSLF